MELIPIPYFGMIMSFIVAPALTFGFILLNRKIKSDIEKLKYKKEILELEIQKEEMHIRLIESENRNLDRLIDAHTPENKI